MITPQERMIAKYLREKASDPRWSEATKVHDWRNHVPERIQELWSTFTDEQRIALVEWADELAGREEWE